MSTSPHSLRVDAQRLRTLATAIENTPAMRLELLADVDTWRGPRPDACLRALFDAQHRVHEAAEDLRREAWLLDVQAQELERALRVVG